MNVGSSLFLHFIACCMWRQRQQVRVCHASGWIIRWLTEVNMSSLLFLYLDVRDATRWPSFIYNLTGKRMAPTKHRKTRDKLYFWLCSTCQTWHLGSHSERKAICLNMAVQSLTWQPNNNWRMRCLSSPDRHSRLHCYKYSNKQICYFCLLC